MGTCLYSLEHFYQQANNSKNSTHYITERKRTHRHGNRCNIPAQGEQGDRGDCLSHEQNYCYRQNHDSKLPAIAAISCGCTSEDQKQK